jgi:hypothetical protein
MCARRRLPRGDRVREMRKITAVLRKITAVLAVVLAAAALQGCTSLTPYRTSWPAGSLDCSSDATGSVPAACAHSILETSTKGPYDLLFVEFDDQGLQYPDPKDYAGANGDQVLGQAREQMNLSIEYLAKLADMYGKLSVVLFIHGWKNDADAANGNVQSFREILSALALAEQSAGADGRHVVGIYVGWRGLSARLEPFEELSFWERKATAQYVAEGSVRALFARLKGFQCSRNDPAGKGGCRIRRAAQSPNIRMLLIGHSFGGLVLFNAIAEDLIDSLTYDIDQGGQPGPIGRFGDMVILLNPAFEATRYTPLERAAERVTSQSTDERYQTPIFVSITTSADWATGLAFPFGRFFNTLFERTTSAEEQIANSHTIGHVDAYITHKLTHSGPDPCPGWSSNTGVLPAAGAGPALSGEDKKQQVQKDLALEAQNSNLFFSRNLKDQKLGPGWVRAFCGGTVLQSVQADPNSPVWNVQTDSTVMTGHSDITNPVLIGFIRQLYEDVTLYPAAAGVARPGTR